MLKKSLFSIILLSTVFLGFSANAASFNPRDFGHKSRDVAGTYILFEAIPPSLLQLTLNKDGTAYFNTSPPVTFRDFDAPIPFVGAWKIIKDRLIVTVLSTISPERRRLADADGVDADGVAAEEPVIGFFRATLELEVRDHGLVVVESSLRVIVGGENPLTSPGRIVDESRERLFLRKVTVQPQDLGAAEEK